MSASFIETFQNLANAVTSSGTVNSFTWDSAIRKFQYSIAGIMLATLTIFESTTSMECSSPVDNDYASSFCREAKWYYVGNSTGHRPYDEFLRYFKWYILIPPIFTIVFAALYGAFVNSHLNQAIKSAARIKDIWDSRLEDPSTFDDSGDVNQTILTIAMCSRIFAESNLNYSEKHCCKVYCCCCCYQDEENDADKKEKEKIVKLKDYIALPIVEDPDDNDQNASRTKVKLGTRTACYFNLYLFIMFIVNVLAVIFFNPLLFSFPSTIACKYQNKDLKYHWGICSVPGHRYARVAVIIIMINHAIGVVSSLMSFIYLHIFIPKTILTADSVIESYTRVDGLQMSIQKCWNAKGRRKIDTLTATSKFILALIYQNIGRLLCFRLVLALVDILKDEEAVDTTLREKIEEIVTATTKEERKEKTIKEIREIILNPISADMMREIIQIKRLTDLLVNILHEEGDFKRAILKAQAIQRATGVQLPRLKDKGVNKLKDLFEELSTKEDLSTEDNKHIAALYDLSKSDEIFKTLEDKEIGKYRHSETGNNHFTDNGENDPKKLSYLPKNAFDKSGFSWRSHNLTSCSSIRRTWENAHTIELIALQASHLYEKATPTEFQFFAIVKDGTDAVTDSGNREEKYIEISPTYWSYDWMLDEWRFFSVNEVPKQYKNKVKSVEIRIFNNGGHEFIEIQKIKIYGKEVKKEAGIGKENPGIVNGTPEPAE